MAFLAPIGAALAGFLGTTGTVATASAVAGIAGTAVTAGSLLSGPKIPKQSGNSITAPSPEKSLVDAQAAADARRRESLLSGGLINPTGGKGSLLATDQTTKKTLLGQ